MISRLSKLKKSLKKKTKTKRSGKELFTYDVKAQLANYQSRLDRLKDMELFVLDNSLRETTVASIVSHTVQNKRDIYEEIQKCGFKYYFIESFTADQRIGELFLQEMIDEGKDLSGAFTFCDAWEKISSNNVPEPDLSIGLIKCKKFGLQNVFLECDLSDFRIDYERFNMKKLCNYMKKKIDWVRSNLSEDGMIFINVRDFGLTMYHHPERMWYLVNFLCKLPAHERITGIAYEDMGRNLMEHLAAWTRAVRTEMERNGWADGQFIFHVHEQWGLMHATNLAVLAAGATGIWCAVCIEGAALGHADSCTTILNMIRLGNTAVQKQYNCKYLRDAAIRVTEITTGAPPDAKQPIYGDRALDMLFGSLVAAMDDDPTVCNGFEMAEFLGLKRTIRVTPMASGDMIITKLKELFGDEPQFTSEIGERMRKKILENAKEGRKEEYNSSVGLAILFNLSGGKMTPAIAAIVDKGLKNAKHIDKLIEEIKVKWDIWDGRDDDIDDKLTYDNFYFGFMSSFISCARGREIQIGLRVLDMDGDGMIDWAEFKFYLVWAGRQYPEVMTTYNLLDKAFRYGLLPAMKEEFDKIREGKTTAACQVSYLFESLILYIFD